ncbi:MAG: glycosyltransferase family 87 protein [Phycisphaerae bacterium]
MNRSAEPTQECTDGADVYGRTLLGRIDRRSLQTPPARWILGGILAVTLVVPSVQFVRRIGKVESSFYRTDKHRTALGRWLPDAEALTRLDEGQDPYGFGHWFPTPPFVLMCLVPFWKLGYTPAGVAWAVLKIVGLVGAMAWLARSLGVLRRAVPVGVLVMAGLFGLRPIVSDLQHGNLNIFMMIWLALAWGMYVRQKDFRAGLLVALAVVTKITPGLVLVYFVYKRAWRVVAGAAVGLLLLFVVLPGAYLGFATNLDLLGRWFDMQVRPVTLDGYQTVTIENQSLNGTCLRLLSNADIIEVEELPATLAEKTGMEQEHMARPVSAAGRLVRPCLSLAILVVLGWLCRRRSTARGNLRDWLEFGLVLLAMLLLSERTWKHHLTTLPIVYLAVWYALACVDRSERFRAWFVAGLVVQWLLLVGTGAVIVGDRVADLLLDGGFVCWGLVLCSIQVAVLLTRTRSAAFASLNG